MIPKPDKPWLIVEAEGERFMVRHADGVVWICRLPDRTVWLLDADKAPAWAHVRGNAVEDPDAYAEQLPMF